MSDNSRSMPDSDCCVFIVGAGASVQHGQPVMNDFMSTACKRYYEMKKLETRHPLVEHYERLFAFQNECLGCSWAVNRNWHNIEEVYTQADLLRLTGMNGAEAICDSIAMSIWDTYRRIGGSSPPVQSLCAQIKAIYGLRSVMVTTNYDCLWEHALTNVRGNEPWDYYYPGFFFPWHHETGHKHPFADGILWEWADEGIEPRRQHNVVPIIKLHGSVNWFREVDVASSKCFASTMFHRGKGPQHFVVTAPEFDVSRFTETFLQTDGNKRQVIPMIVPPMLGKTAEFSPIRDAWNAAIHFLQRARLIVIIGYSFPRTDAFMTRLLAEGLKRNRGLDRIVVTDLQAASLWQERIDHLFPPSMRDYRVNQQFGRTAVDFIEGVRHGSLRL